MNSRWMSEAIRSIQRALSNAESGLIRPIASSRVAIFSTAHLRPRWPSTESGIVRHPAGAERCREKAFGRGRAPPSLPLWAEPEAVVLFLPPRAQIHSPLLRSTGRGTRATFPYPVRRAFPVPLYILPMDHASPERQADFVFWEPHG